MRKLIFKTTIIRYVFFLVVFLVLYSCKNEVKDSISIEKETKIENSSVEKDFLIGSWKDSSEAALDFTIFEDGTARSDNMKTMLYKSWILEGNQITFTIESIGNGNSSTDKITYTIEKLTKNELILKSGTFLSKYIKR